MTGKQCREEHRGEIREKIRRDTVFFSTAVLEWGVHSCLRLLLAAILSGVVILGDKAPLGVAMTAASGVGLLGVERYWARALAVCVRWNWGRGCAMRRPLC